ncbi:Uncharacterized protein Adt_33709 [Abeliophyllum distichum]|uniref:Uncharacterized protein n=1 Tax=Abeliophyllum distichum TaxID=126358 RepID=A0ABD1QZ02_9LAMI
MYGNSQKPKLPNSIAKSRAQKTEVLSCRCRAAECRLRDLEEIKRLLRLLSAAEARTAVQASDVFPASLLQSFISATFQFQACFRLPFSDWRLEMRQSGFTLQIRNNIYCARVYQEIIETKRKCEVITAELNIKMEELSAEAIERSAEMEEIDVDQEDIDVSEKLHEIGASKDRVKELEKRYKNI